MKTDKKKYVLVSLIGALIISIILMFFMYYPIATVVGSSLMLVIGIGYEIYQLIAGNGHFKMKNMLADLLGCVISFLILNFVIFIYLFLKIIL